MKTETIQSIKVVFADVFSLKPGVKMEMSVDNFRAKTKEVQAASEGQLRGYFQREGYFFEGYNSTDGVLIFTGAGKVLPTPEEMAEKYRQILIKITNIYERLINDNHPRCFGICHEIDADLLDHLKYDLKVLEQHPHAFNSGKSIIVTEELYYLLLQDDSGVLTNYLDIGIRIIPVTAFKSEIHKDKIVDPPIVIKKNSWMDNVLLVFTSIAGAAIALGIIYLVHLVRLWMP